MDKIERIIVAAKAMKCQGHDTIHAITHAIKTVDLGELNKEEFEHVMKELGR